MSQYMQAEIAEVNRTALLVMTRLDVLEADARASFSCELTEAFVIDSIWTAACANKPSTMGY